MRLLQRIVTLLFALSILIYGGTRIYNKKFVDRTPPVISFSDQEALQVSIHASEEDYLRGVTARDNKDGDLTAQVIVKNISPLITENTAKVYYAVFDASDNMGTASRIIRYTDYEKPKFSLEEPLIFAPGETITFMDRLKAYDILDGDISDKIRVIMKSSTGNEGILNTTVQVTNSMGDTSTLPLRVIVSSAEAAYRPIRLTKYIDYIDAGSSFDPESYIESVVNEAGKSISGANVHIQSNVDTAEPGNYMVTYSLESNNITYSTYLALVVK